MHTEDTMKTQEIVKAGVCLGLFLAVNSTVGSTRKQTLQQPSSGQQYRSPFRYLIASHRIEGRRSNQQMRYVEILLDEGGFSASNLQQLFKLVSNRFRKPKRLDVQVYTSLKDVETPEEREAPKISEVPDVGSSEIHPQAFFIRDGEGNEWFSYNDKVGSTEMKTVILKGRGPQSSRR